MRQHFTIPGRLDGLNEYVRACRANRYKGAAMKRMNQNVVVAAIREARLEPMGKADVTYIWHEKPAANGSIRDKDNIRFAAKYVNDALVEAGVLEDDGWNHIGELRDEFFRVSAEPRIEVVLEEVG